VEVLGHPPVDQGLKRLCKAVEGGSRAARVLSSHESVRRCHSGALASSARHAWPSLQAGIDRSPPSAASASHHQMHRRPARDGVVHL